MRTFHSNLEVHRYFNSIVKKPSREFKIEPLKDEVKDEPVEEKAAKKSKTSKSSKTKKEGD